MKVKINQLEKVTLKQRRKKGISEGADQVKSWNFSTLNRSVTNTDDFGSESVQY